MNWHWLADPPGTPIEPSFDTQADAETWLADHYEDLVADGAVAVTLHEGDRAVYGPMSLLPE